MPWYILSYIAAMFLSCWMICQAVMKKFAPCCQKGWMISCAVYGVLYGAFYYTACVRPQFTTIAALCGAAALALLVTAEPTDSKGERRLYGIGWIILMLLALNVRYKVGLVTMAVTLCAIGVRVLLQKKLSWRRALGLILTLGVLYGVSVGTTALYKTEDWQSYQQFNIVRSRFMDYPGAPYQDLEDVYTALGWDEPLYNMVRSWYFLDERVTESAFDTIAQANLDWFGEKEQVSALRLGGLLNEQFRPAFLVCGLWMVWLLFLMLQRVHYKKDTWRMTLLAYLPSVCFLLGCVVLLVYFIWQGRAPQRGLDMTMYLSLTPSLLLLPVHAAPERDHTGRRGTLAVSLLLALGLFITASMQNPWRLPDHTAQYAVSDAVEAYCAAHEDQFFIKTSFASVYRPFTIHTREKPHNQLFWGGSSYRSPIFLHQLQSNGYETFYTENLFDENVRFLSETEPSESMMLYLQSLYPSAQWELVDTGEGFQVYRFIR